MLRNGDSDYRINDKLPLPRIRQVGVVTDLSIEGLTATRWWRTIRSSLLGHIERRGRRFQHRLRPLLLWPGETATGYFFLSVLMN